MELKEFFDLNDSAAIAFSGGVDSAYLLYAALRYGARVRAYYVKTQFQPEFELRDAMRLARELDADMKVIPLDILDEERIASNPGDRCYHCKSRILSAIYEAAREDGFELLLDGSNASDDALDRPGMRAAEELRVSSPLRECGLTKADIRRLSREAGLFTWDKPAYACLATRIPYGEGITPDKLAAVEAAEDALSSMGFRDFRVRYRQGGALIQVVERDLIRAVDMRRDVLSALTPHFDKVTLDMEVRDE